MADNWERFEKSATGPDGLTGDCVTINKVTLGISGDLVSHLESNEIAPMFNRKTGEVGLVCCADGRGYTLRQHKKGRAGFITIKSFKKKHRIAEGLYTAVYNEDEGMIIFKPDLEKASR